MKNNRTRSFLAFALTALLSAFPLSAYADSGALESANTSTVSQLNVQDSTVPLTYERERNEQQDQADTVEINATLFGGMGNAADIDWHKVDVPYDGTFEVSIEVDESKVPLSSWHVVIFTPDNSVVVPDGYSFSGHKMTYRKASVAAGTYYIRVNVDPSSYVNGSYYFLTPELTGVDFSRADVSVLGATYDGTPQTPTVTVKYGDDVLEEDTDYTLEYSDNNAPGIGKVTVHGMGMFDGVIQETFEIAAAPDDGSQSGGGTASGGGSQSGSGATSNDGSSSNAGSGSSAGSGVASSSSTSSSTAASSVAMYRLYNPNSGEHFYTADVSERNHLINVGWRGEGLGWYAPSAGEPVYRLYNPNAGDHHYTMSASERDVLVSLGWRSEGIGWHSASSSGVPVYRQYNPNAETGCHNYTTSRSENDYLVSIGWRGEGTGWYAL